MIHRISLGLIFLAFLFSKASAQTCTACFTANVDTLNPTMLNLDASCSNASPNALYDWYVDGIPVVFLPTPAFQLPFTQSGTYTVTLVLMDGACTDSINQQVTINTGCNASYLQYSVSPSSVYFYSLGLYSPTATYSWDFGDGTSDVGQYVLHNYNTPGTYSACLTVTDSGCNNTICQQVNITASTQTGCVASFTTTVDSLLGFLYADASGSSYDPFNTIFNWYINGSLVQQNTSPFLYTPLPSPGIYTVSLVLSDNVLIPCDTLTQSVNYGGIVSPSGCSACMNYYYNTTYDSVYLSFCGILPSNGSVQWLVNGTTVNNSTSPFLQGFANPGLQSITLYVLDSTNTICDSSFVYLYTFTPPCSSCLTVTPVAGSTSDYVFDGSCSSLNYAFNWYVNGNYITTSYSPQFTYSFNQSGSYNVCVESMDSIGNYCSQSCTTVNVTTTASTQFDLSGRIYKFNNNFLYQPTTQGEAKVYLIKLITGGTLEAVDSTSTDANGYYSFANKPIDDYRIKVALNPSSVDYANNIPTYYTSGIMWYDATVVTLFGNTYNRDVYMQYGINSGGNGFISGNVFQGANKGKKTRSGSAQDVTLILVDQSNNEPVAYAKPNASGNYTFSNVPNGTYKVYGELLNRASIPDNIVISASQTSHTNKNFIYTNAVIQPTNQALSVNTIPELSELQIMPNPATSSFTLQNDDQERNVTVLDVTGRLIAQYNLNRTERLTVDCSRWQSGMYLLKSESNGRVKTNRLVIK